MSNAAEKFSGHRRSYYPVGTSALSETSTAIYRIGNMDCPMEEALIRKKLGSLPGITGLEFNILRRLLTVNHQLGSTESIVAALNSIDMKPEPLNPGQAETPIPQTAWGRLLVAGVLAVFSEAFELINEWKANPIALDFQNWTINVEPVIQWLPVILALTAIWVGGLSTYKKGWIAVRNLNLNMNALMSVAVTGAVFIGEYPEAAMVMVLFALAEIIEAKSLDRVRKAIKNILSLAPEKATIQNPLGVWVEVEAREAAIGSRVRVRPGERVALDGVVLDGRSAVNQAPVTGESLPVEKKVGDQVYAGTINESGSFEYRVTSVAANSTLARIVRAVEEAQGSRAPIQRLVDKFSQIYTPAVFLAAFLTALIPPIFMGGAWTEWIYTALVILVIGCPCALVISTPVSIVSGLAAAARHGLLVKGGVFLEEGRRLKWLALDKTGTITHGQPRQTDLVPLGGLDRNEVVTLALSLAARSDHPVSRAIAESAVANGFSQLPVLDFEALPGRGLSGLIDGRKWYLGNHRLADELGKCSPELEELFFGLEKQGQSVVTLIGGNGVQGIIAVADTIKESSFEAIRELKKMGLKTMMLTGDNEPTAQAVAEQAGVDNFKANLLPEDKLALVGRLAETGRVGMVGDGLNDAPALAKADVGFAMAAAGTGAAIETADVCLMDDDLRKIPRFIKLSKSTYAILRQNITLTLGVKAVFFALSFIGLTTMWMAVFADVGLCLLVVANGLRVMRK